MDFGGFLTSASETLFGLVATPVLRHVCYPFRAAANVGRLRDSLKQLNDCLNDIDATIQREVERSGGLKEPTDTARGWLARAREAAIGAEAVARDYDNRSCVLTGACSFDCWSNYWIGRRAEETIQQVETLLGEKPPLDAVTTHAPLPAVQELPADSTVPGGPLEKNLEDAMRFLLEEEEGILGIWGMGGVGKTTLLTKINNSLFGESRFDCVISVVASKDCTVEKLQERILKRLGGLPENQEAATFIFNFLKSKNFVLLIDDVWDTLDLIKVGIPHPLGSTDGLKRKVILTTRSEGVCDMMRARLRIRVDRLLPEHAWSLFQEMVGEETINSHPGILKLAKRVAEECGGLPLALTVVGRAMSTKTSLRDWDDAIRLMQNSKHLSGTENPLFHRLKLSYDNLENDTDRRCFLTCALWPEDYQIPETDLVDCWMGMEIIQDYVSGNSIIAKLKAVCLLEAIKRNYYDVQDKFGYTDTVKMHDIVRDMALWIVSERGDKWTVLHAGLADGRGRWSESHIVSLSYGRFGDHVTFEVPICSNLTTLMLSNNSSLGSYILKGKFLNFNNFYRLTYLDLSSTDLSKFPIGICGLVELRYLNMSDNYIMALPEELKGLNKLKHLILRNNRIKKIPRGLLSRLKELQVLDLFSTSFYAFPILSRLELTEGHHVRAFGINVYTISELHRLISNLSGLSIQSLGVHKMKGSNSIRLSSPDAIRMQSTLNDLHIAYAKIREIIIESSTDHRHQVVGLEVLVYLELKALDDLEAIIWKGVDPKDFFPRLCVVDVKYCGKLRHMSWILHLPCLEHLELWECENLEQLVIESERKIQLDDDQQAGAGAGAGAANSFPSLKSLDLGGLHRMARICDPAVDFPSLERVEIKNCNQLKRLPFRLTPTSNHKKLQEIKGDVKWWEGLEWEEDDSLKSSLLPKFHSI